MEQRENKIIYNKTGKGNKTTSVSIPHKWIGSLGVTEEKREVKLTLLSNKIIISREELKMTMEQVKREMEKELDKIMEQQGYIDDSDGNNERDIDVTVHKCINLLDIKYTADDVECDREDADTAIFEGYEYKCSDRYIDGLEDDLIEDMKNYCRSKYREFGGCDKNGDVISYFVDADEEENIEEYFEKIKAWGVIESLISYELVEFIEERAKRMEKEMKGEKYTIFELDDVLVKNFGEWNAWEDRPSVLNNISEKELIENGSISFEINRTTAVNITFNVTGEVGELESPLLEVTGVEVL